MLEGNSLINSVTSFCAPRLIAQDAWASHRVLTMRMSRVNTINQRARRTTTQFIFYNVTGFPIEINQDTERKVVAVPPHPDFFWSD